MKRRSKEKRHEAKQEYNAGTRIERSSKRSGKRDNDETRERSGKILSLWRDAVLHYVSFAITVLSLDKSTEI